MVDPKVPETDASTDSSAEKAYAAASEGLSAKKSAQPLAPVEPASESPEGDGAPVEAVKESSAPDTSEPDTPTAEPEAGEPEPVVFPAKAKRSAKRRAAAPASAPAKTVANKAKPIPKATPSTKVKPAPKAKVAKKTPANPAAKPLRPAVATTKTPTISQLKDKIMATTTNTPDFAKGIQDAIADIQEKAKAAFEKSTVSFGEVSEFAKGNVEALVESGKILAAGVQELGSAYVSESRAAFETLTADVKELASAKTPADFLKVQSELARRNFDAAVAAGSKNSEAVLKLANEAFAPISGRFSLAVDKIKKAA